MATSSEIQGNQHEWQLVPTFASLQEESLLPPSFDPTHRPTADEFERDYPARAKIWQQIKNPKREVSLNDLNNLSKRRTWLYMANNLDRYVSSHNGSERKTLKGRQMNVFEDIQRFLEEGGIEGFVDAPTGFGKTVLFGEVVAATDVPTVIVVPKRRLVEQTYESFKKFNPHLDVGRVSTDYKELGRQVTITTYQTLTSDPEGQKIDPTGVALTILDEVDEATGPERVKTLERFPDSVMIGFSATPIKISGEEHADKRVAKLMENEIHNISLIEGVEEGYLSPFSSYIVEVDADISNVRILSNGNYSEGELDQVINNKIKNEAAVKFFLEMKKLDVADQRKTEKRKIEPLTTSTYANSVAHAQELAKEYQAAGVKAAAVWGDQNPREQDDIMQKWAKGEIEVVCSKDLLVRGSDLPRIRMVQNVAPTTSYQVEKQRCGRGLRLDPNNPDKHTIIADFVYKNSANRGHQITFPEITQKALGRARKVSSEPNNVPNGQSNGSASLPPITIEGLKVVTNSEEVMKVVNQMSEHRNMSIDVQETDFIINSASIFANFIGDSKVLAPFAKNVFEEFKRQHPELIARRLNKSRWVEVVTDRDIFIEAMVNAGAKLRATEVADELQPTDFPITTHELKRLFQGQDKKLLQAAQQVTDELMEKHPELFAQRKNANNRIRVYQDRDQFIATLIEKGLVLKQPEILPLQPDDNPITGDNMLSLFLGKKADLMSIAEAALIEIRAEHPELIQKRRSGKSHIIDVISDRDLLIRLMQEKGARLRNTVDINSLQPNDFVVAGSNLSDLFIGNTARVRKAARQVTEELMLTDPSLVRYTQIGGNVMPVIDVSLIKQKMAERGFNLREE